MKKIIILLSVFITTICCAQKPTLVVPDGHNYPIKKIVVDKQGKYVFTAALNRCLMWEAKTGRQLYSFKFDNSGDYIGMDLSPDGSIIAIASGGNLFLYTTQNGKKIELDRLPFGIYDVRFSTDGNDVYLASTDGIHILNAKTLVEKETIKEDFTGYSPRIWLVANDKVLIAGNITQGTGCRIYDINTKQKISSFDLPEEKKFSQFTFLPKQNLLAAYSYGSGVGLEFYDVYSGLKKGSIACQLDNGAIVPSENTNEILISGEPDAEGSIISSSLNLYSTESFKKINTFKNGPSVNGGYFNGLAKRGWFHSNTNEVGNYDLNKNIYTVSLKGFVADFIKQFGTMVYNNNNSYLHLTTNDNNFKTIDLAQMKSILHRDLKVYPDAVAISFTGDTVAVFIDNVVTVKNIKTSAIIKTFSNLGMSEGMGRQSNFFFSNDNKFLFYSDGNVNEKINNGFTNIIKLNLVTGLKKKFISAKAFGSTTVNADKTLMAGFETGYKFNTAVVWDLATGKRIFTKATESFVIQISNDKKRVLLLEGKYYKRFDLATNKLIDSSVAATDNIHVGEIFSGDFSSELKSYTWPGGMSGAYEQFFSSDGKVFYTIEDFDNKIKAWEAATGRFIGTLYLFKESNDYVFMDADGRFDGTPEGVKQIYYVINKKPLPLDKIFEKYYTPNLYVRSVAGEKFDKIDVNIKPFPKAKISYAEAKRNLSVEEDGVPLYKNNTGIAEITINATAPEDKVDEIRLFHNGKVVNLATRGLFVTDNDGTESKKYVVNLLPGNNNFSAIALDSQRTESDVDEINVSYSLNVNQPISKPIQNNNNTAIISPIDKNATMYLMVVGINAYTNKVNPLTYALPDATSFKDEIEKDAKSVLANVKTYFITDAKADKAGIVNAFNEIKKEAKPQDVFVFYYAGHGYISPTNKEFYLVSADVADGGESLLKNGIPAKDLQQYAVDIQAQKQLFILDACQSAGAFDAMLKHDGEQQKSLAVVARSTGTHWMAASGSTETAKEFGELGHGAFTYALLQGLKGQAALNKMITVNGMKNFLQVQVPELVKKYGSNNQYPASYGFGNDFPVEIVK